MTQAATVKVIGQAKQAAALLHPMRLRVLERLGQPDSASGLARLLKLPRQKVNYHIRALEKAGLVEQVGEQRKGNCVERMVQAVAASYLVSTDALGSLGADPSRIADKFSSSYMVALAARTICELAILQERADKAKKPLATLSLQADVRFASAEDRSAFSEELAHELARLVAKFHNETAGGGRVFRFVLGAYPAITKTEEQSNTEQEKRT